LAGYSGEQAALYASLKLAGLDCAPVHLAVFADRGVSKGSGLGRRTMPEMLEYSVVAAITTLWLAARAFGIGMGWVSILDPGTVSAILAVDEGWHLVAYLCLGYPEEESQIPELERAGWEKRETGEVRLLHR
jgi:5,6-dimethylbenzimidazole synthase